MFFKWLIIQFFSIFLCRNFHIRNKSFSSSEMNSASDFPTMEWKVTTIWRQSYKTVKSLKKLTFLKSLDCLNHISYRETCLCVTNSKTYHLEKVWYGWVLAITLFFLCYYYVPMYFIISFNAVYSFFRKILSKEKKLLIWKYKVLQLQSI